MAFKMKEGPCGSPGFPSCQDELIRMAKKDGANESYLDSIKVSDVGSMKKPSHYKGASYMSRGNVNKSINAETKRRANDITSHPSYETLTQNLDARPMVSRVNNYLNNAKNNKNQAINYMIPSLKETDSLLQIGTKYIDSSNIAEDISTWDKGRALYQGWKLLSKYPNLEKIAKKYN